MDYGNLWATGPGLGQSQARPGQALRLAFGLAYDFARPQHITSSHGDGLKQSRLYYLNQAERSNIRYRSVISWNYLIFPFFLMYLWLSTEAFIYLITIYLQCSRDIYNTLIG